MWNIEQKAPVHTVDTHEFITTVSFTLNGKLAIAGLHSGMCTFFNVEVWLYFLPFIVTYTLKGLVPAGKIYVHSSRGKNKKGKKISGIEALPDGKSVCSCPHSLLQHLNVLFTSFADTNNI
jgi:WD repeat-containing protein 44